MREICTSGSVRDEGGNVLVYSAAGVHHAGRAEATLVSDVVVRLENPREGAEELLRPFSCAAHAEIEDHAAARRAVLPQEGAMILAALILYPSKQRPLAGDPDIVRLHIDRGFVCTVPMHGLSAGANPARQLSFQPVAIGATVEVTKRLKPSMERVIE